MSTILSGASESPASAVFALALIAVTFLIPWFAASYVPERPPSQDEVAR